MVLLDLTFPSPEENLACEEALLDACDAGQVSPLLRFWEPSTPCVVLGHGNRLRNEVNQPECQRLGIPILRRTSGGGTVVQGPGCLNYALILRAGDTGPLASVTAANRFIMQRVAHALTPLAPTPLAVQGHTDLTLAGRKCAGNAQRRKRRALLFHGTILLDFDLSLIARLLPPLPPKQPDYRLGRSHADFLTNLGLPAAAVKTALARAWAARLEPLPLPDREIQELAARRYADPAWTAKL